MQRGRLNEVALEVRELVIQGLARLICANTESGVKHSLAFAYDLDPLKKLIFIKVFSRVMIQSPKLDAPEARAPLVARSRLFEMIKGPDVRPHRVCVSRLPTKNFRSPLRLPFVRLVRRPRLTSSFRFF